MTYPSRLMLRKAADSFLCHISLLDAQHNQREDETARWHGQQRRDGRTLQQEAVVYHFLLELGGDFTFVGRQRRLRIGDSWFRVDLLFFHRRLRCLVIIDLKLTELNHADVGQMHMYCNYAKEHWTLPGENPPVGLILCARTNAAIARYALEGLPNKVLAAEYHTLLPRKVVRHTF